MKNNRCAFTARIVLTLSLSFALAITSFAQTPPATCTAAIGSPANGASHYLSITWSAVGGATSYELEYSTNGTNWNPLSSGSTATAYNHNATNIGNMPFYYRVRTVVGVGQSGWTNCTQYPIYTACDVPSLPQLASATSSGMDVTLVAESPDLNPSYTTYSIYCTTTSQYVQANGTLGATEVFQTMSAWGTKTVTGLSASTNCCFYAKAKNMDGDVRIATGGTIIGVEPFTTNSNFSSAGCAGPTNKFWVPPSSCNGGNPVLQYQASGGCAGGQVSYAGSFNNYFGSFLRTPQWNCTGSTSVILNFDISNSYIPSHINGNSSYVSNDGMRFTMYVDGGYKNASSIKIGGAEVSYYDVNNGYFLKFDQARTCVNVSVTFDLAIYSNITNILFYLEPNCGYNDSQVFSVGIDNVSLKKSSGTATSCLSTTACTAATIQSDPSTQTVCVGSNASFTVGTAGTVSGYQWEVRANSSALWSTLNNGGPYSNATTATLNITGVTTGMNGFQFRCIVNSPCGSNSTSQLAALIVNTTAPASVSISSVTGTSICAGSPVTFTAIAINGGNTPFFQWKIDGNNAGTNNATFTTSSLSNGNAITCIMTSNATCATGSPATSNSVVISVTSGGAVAGTVSVLRDTVCSGTPTTLSVTGSSGAIQWQTSSISTGGFTDINGATSSSYINVIAQNSYLRVVAKNGNCTDTSVAKKVVIVPSPVADFSFTLNGKTATFNSAGTSQDVTSYEWNFDDGSAYSNQANPVHTFSKDTVYLVCFEVYNGSNCSFTICRDVTIGTTTTVNPVDVSNELSIYPNPVTTLLAVSSNPLAIKRIEIINVLGQTLLVKDISGGVTKTEVAINEIRDGVYFLKVFSGNEIQIQRVIKQ